MKNKILLTLFVATMSFGSSSVFAALTDGQSVVGSAQTLSHDGVGESAACNINPFCKKK